MASSRPIDRFATATWTLIMALSLTAGCGARATTGGECEGSRCDDRGDGRVGDGSAAPQTDDTNPDDDAPDNAPPNSDDTNSDDTNSDDTNSDDTNSDDTNPDDDVPVDDTPPIDDAPPPPPPDEDLSCQERRETAAAVAEMLPVPSDGCEKDADCTRIELSFSCAPSCATALVTTDNVPTANRMRGEMEAEVCAALADCAAPPEADCLIIGEDPVCRDGKCIEAHDCGGAVPTASIASLIESAFDEAAVGCETEADCAAFVGAALPCSQECEIRGVSRASLGRLNAELSRVSGLPCAPQCPSMPVECPAKIPKLTCFSNICRTSAIRTN